MSSRRAARSPLRTTIAHGYLSLSLIGSIQDMRILPDNTQGAFNHGIDHVRFLAPCGQGRRAGQAAHHAAVDGGQRAGQYLMKASNVDGDRGRGEDRR